MKELQLASRQRNRTLAYFHVRLAQQKKLLACVRGVLPEMLAEQVQHCVLHDDELLLYTKTASLLRFHEPLILEAVSSLIQRPLYKLTTRIMTTFSNSNAVVSRKAKVPSATTIEMLRKDGLAVQDEELKNALLKLSATLAKHKA